MQTFEPRTKTFQRNKQDFVCDACDLFVVGDGYRNHCPHCLLSKHVDNNPGDRAARCHGLMDVVDIALEHGKLIFTHACRRCHIKKRNRAHPEDRTETIVDLMRQFARA